MLETVVKSSKEEARKSRAKSTLEEYMCGAHLRQFKELLTAHRRDLIALADRAALGDVDAASDPVDRASQETECAAASAAIARARRQIKEIDAALLRIEQGEYGYCEDTGEPIGLERLRVNPSARYTVEALTVREKRSRQFGAN